MRNAGMLRSVWAGVVIGLVASVVIGAGLVFIFALIRAVNELIEVLA